MDARRPVRLTRLRPQARLRRVRADVGIGPYEIEQANRP